MGLDFGEKHIGVAVTSQVIDHPQALETITNKNGVPDWIRFDALVAVWEPDLFVIGKAEKTSRSMQQKINAFADALQQRYGRPLDFVAEDFSSLEAGHYLSEQRKLGLRKKTQRGDLDQIAAALILETWLVLRKTAEV